MYTPPPDIPDYVSINRQDGINHNLLLSLRYQQQLYPKDFSFVIKDVRSFGYEIPHFINESFVRNVFNRAQSIDYSNPEEIKKLYNVYKDTPSMQILSSLIDTLYKSDLAFDEFVAQMDLFQDKANGLKDAETPYTLLQISLATIRSSGYFWYMKFHS
jgi:hypothetical protein